MPEVKTLREALSAVSSGKLTLAGQIDMLFLAMDYMALQLGDLLDPDKDMTK